MKKVIIYYSYRGNTKSIAEMIQKSTGADIARIETVVPYDGDYNSVVNQGQDEVNSGYCPKIKPLNIDLSKYDEVILGTPVWWYTFAPAMHTFLKENDLSGKTVYPFATNGCILVSIPLYLKLILPKHLYHTTTVFPLFRRFNRKKTANTIYPCMVLPPLQL